MTYCYHHNDIILHKLNQMLCLIWSVHVLYWFIFNFYRTYWKFAIFPAIIFTLLRFFLPYLVHTIRERSWVHVWGFHDFTVGFHNFTKYRFHADACWQIFQMLFLIKRFLDWNRQGVPALIQLVSATNELSSFEKFTHLNIKHCILKLTM